MYKRLIVIFLFLDSCSINQVKKEAETNCLCDSNVYSKNIERYINNFKPTNLNLDSSIIHYQELKAFLDTVSLTCLEKQSEYREFVYTILIKEYYFQQTSYNQSFDLLQMRNGSAKIIIDGFIKLSRIDKNIEMLSSGYIVEYLKKHPEIKSKQIDEYQKLISKALASPHS